MLTWQKNVFIEFNAAVCCDGVARRKRSACVPARSQCRTGDVLEVSTREAWPNGDAVTGACRVFMRDAESLTPCVAKAAAAGDDRKSRPSHKLSQAAPSEGRQGDQAQAQTPRRL